jgi:hypothetical protein
VDDTRFLKRKRGLGGDFLGEGVVPWESDLDLGKAELKQLELPKVLVD